MLFYTTLYVILGIASIIGAVPIQEKDAALTSRDVPLVEGLPEGTPELDVVDTNDGGNVDDPDSKLEVIRYPDIQESATKQSSVTTSTPTNTKEAKEPSITSSPVPLPNYAYGGDLSESRGSSDASEVRDPGTESPSPTKNIDAKETDFLPDDKYIDLEKPKESPVDDYELASTSTSTSTITTTTTSEGESAETAVFDLEASPSKSTTTTTTTNDVESVEPVKPESTSSKTDTASDVQSTPATKDVPDQEITQTSDATATTTTTSGEAITAIPKTVKSSKIPVDTSLADKTSESTAERTSDSPANGTVEVSSKATSDSPAEPTRTKGSDATTKAPTKVTPSNDDPETEKPEKTTQAPDKAGLTVEPLPPTLTANSDGSSASKGESSSNRDDPKPTKTDKDSLTKGPLPTTPLRGSGDKPTSDRDESLPTKTGKDGTTPTPKSDDQPSSKSSASQPTNTGKGDLTIEPPPSTSQSDSGDLSTSIGDDTQPTRTSKDRTTTTSDSSNSSSSKDGTSEPTKTGKGGLSIEPPPTTSTADAGDSSSSGGDGTRPTKTGSEGSGGDGPDGPSSSVTTTAKFKSTEASISTDEPEVTEAVQPSYKPKWKLHGHAIHTGKPSLPQKETNGDSKLGTFKAPKYQQYKGQEDWGDVKDPSKCPWGDKSASNTNTYKDAPDTGKTQEFEWTIERAILAPDGVNRSMILVNGAFPGPTIEANWGDTIKVTVHNKIVDPGEGTSIHWHGFLQKDTPWEDGVPGITQCPIPPGESFTYIFKADLYGTSWWHAHYSAQYMAGIYGAMIIHGPNQDGYEYDADLGPLLLADYYRGEYFSLVQQVMGTDITKVAPKSDNNLINGKGIVNCSTTAVSDTTGLNSTSDKPCTENAGLARFNVTSGRKYRMRLINSGAEGLQKFSIDEHDMTVVAYDFVPIKPYVTETVTLGVGQRADVILEAKSQNTSGIYWVRSTMTKCSLTNQPNGLGILYYEDADTDATPAVVEEEKAKTDDAIAKTIVDKTNPCGNDELDTAIPYFPIKPPSKPTKEQIVDIAFGKNSTGNFVWTVNNSTFRVNYNHPILSELVQGNKSDSFPTNWNVYDFDTAESIRIILNNHTPAHHPMHIHGHNMYVLSSTQNVLTSNVTSTATPNYANMENPTRRDVQILAPYGQVVVQIDADNPGVWPLHCHIAWHVSGGLYMNVVERPADIAKYQWPDRHAQLCQAWDNWQAKNEIKQIDSGLKRRAVSW